MSSLLTRTRLAPDGMAEAPSPFGLESHYQHLLDLLDAPVSERWTLVQIAGVLGRIDLRRAEAESYLLPLIEPMAEAAGTLDPVGLSPNQIETLLEALRTARGHHAAVRDLDVARKAETALRRRTALLYAYAGATRRAASLLDPDQDVPIQDDIDASGPRARLEEALSRATGSPLEEKLRWLERHWDREQEGKHTTHIPVIERLPSWARPDVAANADVGALRQVGIELYGPSDTTDRLQVDVLVHGADEVDVTAVPLNAARRLLDERHPRLTDQYVQGRLAFDRRHLEHGGRSAGLAIAALFYGAVLDYTQRRRRLSLRPDLVVTGSMTAEGRVEAIEEEALSTKVRTAFFSPKTTLVVPEAQQAAATTARDALLDPFPHGNLEIVGVDRFEALFYDRRLTRQEQVGWARHTAQRLWHRRGPVLAGTVIGALLLIIAWLLYGPIDQNPVQAEFSGEIMFVQNAAGRTIEQIEVGEEVIHRFHQGASQPPASFVDLTGEKRNEIVWLSDPEDGSQAPVLKARSLSADTLLWTFPLQFDISFPQKETPINPAYHFRDLVIDDLDEDGRPEGYLVVKHTTFFPGLILKFDPRTGQENQRYVHPGNFYTKLQPADLNGDGARELLIGGYSNAFEAPILAILSPQHIEGHAPTTEEYAVANTDLAPHPAYLRFPATAVQEASPLTAPRIRKLQMEDAPRRVTVEATDGYTENGDWTPYVAVHFDADLRPVALGTSSGYDRLAEKLVREGRLDAVPDADAFERYRQEIQYWTGSGWTSEPTIGHRWQMLTDTTWSSPVPEAFVDDMQQ